MVTTTAQTRWDELADLSFPTGDPSEGARRVLLEEYFFQRAVQVYLGAARGCASRLIGMFTDFWQRALTDVGIGGPDQGKGGLYLLLPPDYDGPVPGGYHACRSPTYNVFLFWRHPMAKGGHGPDMAQAGLPAETIGPRVGTSTRDSSQKYRFSTVPMAYTFRL